MNDPAASRRGIREGFCGVTSAGKWIYKLTRLTILMAHTSYDQLPPTLVGVASHGELNPLVVLKINDQRQSR